MKKYVLAIDQGTTSTRAILFDEKQEVVKVSQKELTNSFPKPGWVEQDGNEIWLSTLSVMANIFSTGEVKPSEVAAIGITNQRETTVLWDKNTGLPLYNAIVWQSRQTNDLIEKYRQTGKEEWIHQKTGLVLDPYFSASKIRFILDKLNIEDTSNILFGTIDTYLLWKMTNGKVHATDVSNASRTLLFNIHTLSWDDELLEFFDIPKNILPEIKDTACEFGYIDPRHFFNETCPICALVGDQQAALFGQSCFKEGDIKNTYGTGGFMLMNTGEKLNISNDGLLSTVAWKIGDELNYALEGSIFVSGSLIQWLRDELHFFDKASQSEEIARRVEDSNGVIVVPAFTGLGAPYWNENCKGAIFGLSRGSNISHLVRASLEAMAFQSKDLLSLMEKELGKDITMLKVDGGASANKLLLQFQSDILGIDVFKSAQQESTALGAARLAGLVVGLYKREDFEKEEGTRIKASMSKIEAEELYKRWLKAVRACQEF